MYFRSLIFLLLSFAFSPAQTVSVKSVEPLTTAQDGIFSFPQFSRDGTKIIFTTPSHKGLYIMDIKERKIIRLSNEPGAGYQPWINGDGSEVIYRTYQLEKGRRFYSLIKFNTNALQKKVLENHVRSLSTPQYLNQGEVGYIKSRTLLKKIEALSLNKKVISHWETLVLIENRKLALFMDGQKKILQPAGPGSYIWPEIAPDGRRLLFKKLGDSCYISDLQGKIILSLGNIDAPHWSPDGEWIVYMADKDDGYRLTASEIHLIRSDGRKNITLTHTNDVIELYPRWGKDNNTIIFCSAKGQIFLMELEWK